MKVNHNIALSASGVSVREPLHPEFHSMALFDDMFAYYNCARIFYSYFGAIPSIIALKHIDSKKMMRWMESHYAADIENQHYRKVSKGKGKGFTKSNAIYVLRNKIIVDHEPDHSVRIYFLSESEAQAQDMAVELEAMIKTPRQERIAIVTDKGNGPELLYLAGKKIKTDLHLHYNDDLLPVHEMMMKNLGPKSCSGLVLLHGIPGTGKSMYIRFLAQQLKKKAIFLPSKSANNLGTPGFVNLLFQHPNSILVIEDAEDILYSRESGYNSNLASLLSITDGVLGETLGIPVIATFNTRVSNIDKALLRNGRLKGIYEFKSLTPAKVQALLESRGLSAPGYAMTLAEALHYPEGSYAYHDARKQEMGFAR
jgi:hypothetical protein